MSNIDIINADGTLSEGFGGYIRHTLDKASRYDDLCVQMSEHLKQYYDNTALRQSLPDMSCSELISLCRDMLEDLEEVYTFCVLANTM